MADDDRVVIAEVNIGRGYRTIILKFRLFTLREGESVK